MQMNYKDNYIDLKNSWFYCHEWTNEMLYEDIADLLALYRAKQKEEEGEGESRSIPKSFAEGQGRGADPRPCRCHAAPTLLIWYEPARALSSLPLLKGHH